MKKFFALTIITLGLNCAQADQIVLWDFNSLEEDFDPVTGTFEPAIGTGTCQVVGGATSTFATTEPGSSDPSGDNSSLRTSTYPAQGAGSKTRGVEFLFSTVGFENIQATWDYRNSAASSRYWRIQYTLNGTDWVDYTVIANTAVDLWRNGFGVVDFSPISGAANNANFGFRVVSEFQFTAIGHGSRGYVTTSTASGSYSVNGLMWMDMVSVTGTPFDSGNSYPTISQIANQTANVSVASAAIPFTIGDTETAPDNLGLDARFSNPLLIEFFYFEGSGTNRTLFVVPKTQIATGVKVWVVVTDAGGKQNSSSFNLDILDPDNPPVALPYTLANFEEFGGRNNASVLFRLPNFSGDNVGVTTPNIAQVKNISTLPEAVSANPNIGQEVMHLNWGFTAAEGSKYLRLRTAPNAGFSLGNPIISFEHPFQFEIFTEQPLQICLLLRETNSEGDYGTDGGISGSVKWIGGSGVYNTNMSVSSGVPVPANQWVTLVFDIPALAQSAVPRTGSGPLFSTSGKGVLEALGLIGNPGTTHNVYLDNFTILPVVASASLNITKANGSVEISWPSSATGFTLQKTLGLNPASWDPVTVELVNDKFTVTLPATETSQFFRLIK